MVKNNQGDKEGTSIKNNLNQKFGGAKSINKTSACFNKYCHSD